MTPRDKALTGVAEANNALQTVDRLLRRRVKEARRHGATWQVIGDTLKISRQAAWEQFHQDTN